tara:strand:- start:2762 stop:3076 length:315 start_codon:yes stop_codon:yes gene_type:complete
MIKFLIKNQENIFNISLFLSYLLYFIAFFQIQYYNPEYLDILQTIIKYYVIIFLLIKFHPFSKSAQFSSFDRRIVFSSAIFLLTTTALVNIVKHINPINYIYEQ